MRRGIELVDTEENIGVWPARLRRFLKGGWGRGCVVVVQATTSLRSLDHGVRRVR
jgi:hypothetical protein